MMPVSRPARVLVTIAVVSLLAMVFVYAFPPGDRRLFTLLTDLSWSWAAAFAGFACYTSAGRVTTSEQRRTWLWIGAGCASFFVGQLVWTSYDLWRGAPPPYPSLADVGFLGIYVCVMVGVFTLVRGQPLRRADPELADGVHLQRTRATRPEANNAARIVALVIGLAGMPGMAVIGLSRPIPDSDDAVIVGIGMAIVAVRVLYSLGVTQRYAQILEDE